MHDFLKEIAEANDWVFVYGRHDYLNLYNDLVSGKIYLLVEPITADSTFTDAGNENLSYSGKLYLSYSSDVDEEYQDKYNDYIKPLFSDTRKKLISAFVCSDYELKIFKTTEVINVFDQNHDGILINYSAKYHD